MSAVASEPHPAFPSYQASGSLDNKAPISPPTAAELKTIIGQSNSLTTVRRKLIPALERAAKEQDQTALLQADERLEELPDSDLPVLTAALVYILTARLTKANGEKKSAVALLELASRLIAKADVEQLRLCLPRVSLFSWALLRQAQISKKVEDVLGELYKLTMVTPERSTMTGSHAAVLEACLLTRRYQGLEPLIHGVYTDFVQASCTYLDVLTFYHHAGLIMAAQQSFAAAKELFSVAISVPTRTTSAIQVASAKRAILCELLNSGKSLRFKDTTSSTVTMAIERSSTEYTNLAKAFGEQKWEAVYRQAEDGKNVFDKDCNSGLVQQVVESIIKRKILKAGGIYTRLSVDQLLAKVAGAKTTTAEELLAVINSLISKGELRATVSGSIISFLEDDASRGTDVLTHLAQSRGLASWLESHLTVTGKHLGLDPKYLRRQAGIIDAANGPDETPFGPAPGSSRRGVGVGGPVRGVATNLDDMGF